jgi:hypothetical protein
MFYMLQQYLSQILNAIADTLARIRDAVYGGDGESPIQDPGTPVTGDLIGSVSDDHGLLINVYGEEVDGGISMTVKVMEGVADLRGFFMDVGDSTAGVCVDGVASQDLKIRDESVTTVGSRDNNMTGTGETFDVGIEIGTSGYSRDDVSQAHFTLEGVTLEQLDGLTFGVRATSVGEDRADAVKLLGEFDTVPEPQPEEPPVEPPADPSSGTPTEPTAEPPAPTPSIGGNFPALPDNITSIVLVYNTTAGDVNGDGYYAAKVENVTMVVEDDLDLWLIDATNYLANKDPNIDTGTELLGVAITHGDNGATDYYAMDGDQGADTAPTTDLTPETTVDYDSVMG